MISAAHWAILVSFSKSRYRSINSINLKSIMRPPLVSLWTQVCNLMNETIQGSHLMKGTWAGGAVNSPNCEPHTSLLKQPHLEFYRDYRGQCFPFLSSLMPLVGCKSPIEREKLWVMGEKKKLRCSQWLRLRGWVWVKRRKYTQPTHTYAHKVARLWVIIDKSNFTCEYTL